VLEKELYDHQNDPRENRNVVNQPGNRQLIEKLSQMLRKGRNVSEYLRTDKKTNH
jgi:hypothetical protein